MKKIFIMFMIIITIILAFSMSAYAEYIEPLPDQPSEFPCIFIGGADYEHATVYVLYYSNIPVRLENYRQLITGMYVWDVVYPQGIEFVRYQQVGSSEWTYQGRYSFDEETVWAQVEYVVYTNSSLGTALIDLEVSEYNNSFFGIDFDYSGFLGNLKVQLGKKEESGTYKTIKEWQYPKGSGHVSIPASQIPQGNKGEYIITIYEGDTIIQQYPYTLNVDVKDSYCEINYPVNGQDYYYYPNVNIRYYDMGRLYIYINGEMYKQIQTANREGIELIDGQNELFDIGLNDVTVKDSNGQVVATVQYMVMREGLDPDYELPEYEAESWVQELFNKIMDEYSLFFEYVRGIYGFLPVEIVGLVVIIMMLAVVLWFTGRK